MVGLLFDNDGVLIDSSALHWRAWQLFMEEEKKLNLDYEGFISTFGKRNDLILEGVAPDVPEIERKKWADRKEELFRQCAQKAVTLLPGMERFLEEVKEARIPRIIASSTPVENLKMFLSTTLLGDYFDTFVSAEQVPHGKPFPDVFIEGAHRLGLESQECIVLEDAPAGIEAGKRAGCFIVALGTTHEKKTLRDYDLFFPSPKELDLKQILSSFKTWKDHDG